MNSDPNNFKESIHSVNNNREELSGVRMISFSLSQFNNTSHSIVNDERTLIWKLKCSQKQSLEEPNPLSNIFLKFDIILLLYFPIVEPAIIHLALRSSTGVFNSSVFLWNKANAPGTWCLA